MGSIVHNTQTKASHADGHIVSDDEVLEAYLHAAELGERYGCIPCFEVHVNMWSEDFVQISKNWENFRITRG